MKDTRSRCRTASGLCAAVPLLRHQGARTPTESRGHRPAGAARDIRWGVPTTVLPSRDELLTALSRVNDPEIRKPITELGHGQVGRGRRGGRVAVAIFLTVAGLPMKETLTRDVTAALPPFPASRPSR